MRSKKKSCERIMFDLPEETLEKLKRVPESCYSHFMDINSASDAIRQINLLKEVQNIISRRDPEQLALSSLDVNILCFMFYQSRWKSPHEKTLNRILQDLSQGHAETVKISLQESFEAFLTFFLQTPSVKGIEKYADCLQVLLIDFLYGPSIIQENCKTVWKYLNESFNFVVNKLIEQNCTDLYETCQMLLHAYSLILHNCEQIRNFLVLDNDEDMRSCSHGILKAIETLLISNSTTANCRLKAGIAICHYHFVVAPLIFKAEIFKESKNHLFELESFPLSSQLCIYHGIMAVFFKDELVLTSQDYEIIEVILHKFFHVSESVEDADLLLFCTRGLNQWCIAISKSLRVRSKKVDVETIHLEKMFQEDGCVMERLFQYVLQCREHYMDTLRHLSKDLFRNILKLHIFSIDIDPHKSPLLQKMTVFLLNDLPCHSQGKYGLLSSIVEIVKTATVLQWHPSLPENLYEALKEVNLISHVSELLKALFANADNAKFEEIWLRPLLKFLNTDSKELSAAINEHVIPILFKEKACFIHYMVRQISSLWEQSKGDCFSSLITCMKFHQRMNHDQSIYDFISVICLTKALCHADDQVRLSAFSLICENPRTTEAIPVTTFYLLKDVLQYNMNCQAPAFRQQLVSYMKKLISRMVESKYSLERKMQASMCDVTSAVIALRIEVYKEFVRWLKSFLYGCLYPGANFPRRVTALNLLFLLHKTFSETLSIVETLDEAQTLLFALEDTYENNKIIALQILQSSNASILELEDENYLETLLQTALILASSTKPPDTVTAAYMFAFIVKSDSFNTLLKNLLLKQMEEDIRLLPCEMKEFSTITHSSSFVSLLLLMGELLKHLKVAQKSLLDAAAYAPLYGILACIRSIISQLDFRSLIDEFSISQWTLLVHKLISISLKVASVVEPVVCNSSPEGHLPMDTDSGNILQLQAAVRRAIGKRFQAAVVGTEDTVLESDQVVLDMVKTHAVTAQILLLCCWRTHKEVSLLFGEISDRIPIKNVGEENGSGFLDITQVMDIGEYFMCQMTLVKHKGAFEQAYVGFSKLCNMLWRSSVSKLQQLPKVWLNDLFLAIRGLKDNTQLCSTRRSAGLPFIIQALLTSEPGISSSLFFKDTISSLLSMAAIQSDQENLDEKIHALNILRALFRDACLSDVLIPFVSEALKVSITGFKSHSWAVRNSSTLLFSALMTRIFGVVGPQDEAGKKNRLTGRTFFFYYKDMYAFLYSELEQCASVLSQNQHSVSLVPALYPILLVLGRLYPAPGECDSRLTSFIQFLDVCSGSPVWKVRVLVAKALVPLISTANFFSTLQSLFDSLPHNGEIIQSHNRIHGKCLQILYLLRECYHLSQDYKILIEKNLHSWIHSHSELASKFNKCYTIRAAFLEIVLLALTMNTSLDAAFQKNIAKEVLSEIKTVSADPDKEHYLCLAVILLLLCLQQMQKEQMNEFLHQIDSKCDSLPHTIKNLLSTPYENVRNMVLWFLICIFQIDTPCGFIVESSINPIFFSSVIATPVQALVVKHQRFSKELCKDRNFNQSILRMLVNEQVNSSCFGMVCHLLCLMPLALDIEWDFSDQLKFCNTSSKLDYVLSHLQSCKREEISNPISLFATRVAAKVYKQLLKNQFAPGTDTSNRCLGALRKWSETMEGNSQPENCISVRRAVVTAFQIIPKELFFEKYEIVGGIAVNLWQALLFLLMDDEPEIKKLACEFIISMKGSDELEFDVATRNLPLVPMAALNFMVEMFISTQVCSPSQYVAILLNWMLSCKIQALDCVGDEQPFDRGELNVYAEDLLVTELIHKCLFRYLCAYCIRHHSSLAFFKVCNWKSIADLKEEDGFTIDQVVTSCLSESEQILDRLLSRGAVSPLLDTHFDVDLLQISQRLHSIMCFAPWISITVKCLALELLKKMSKVACKTVFFEELLSEAHMSLSEIDDR